MDTERNPTMFGGNRFQPAAGRRRPAMALGRAAVHPDERRLFRGGSRWVLNPCPWNSDHTSRAAFIVQFPNGAIAAGCHHNGCAGKDWHALRDVYEPGWRASRQTRAQNGVNGSTPHAHEPVADGPEAEHPVVDTQDESQDDTATPTWPIMAPEAF